MNKTTAIMMVALLPLAGCGSTKMDRSLSGTRIGAGTTAAASARLGGNRPGCYLAQSKRVKIRRCADQ